MSAPPLLHLLAHQAELITDYLLDDLAALCALARTAREPLRIVMASNVWRTMSARRSVVNTLDKVARFVVTETSTISSAQARQLLAQDLRFERNVLTAHKLHFTADFFLTDNYVGRYMQSMNRLQLCSFRKSMEPVIVLPPHSNGNGTDAARVHGYGLSCDRVLLSFEKVTNPFAPATVDELWEGDLSTLYANPAASDAWRRIPQVNRNASLLPLRAHPHSAAHPAFAFLEEDAQMLTAFQIIPKVQGVSEIETIARFRVPLVRSVINVTGVFGETAEHGTMYCILGYAATQGGILVIVNRAGTLLASLDLADEPLLVPVHGMAMCRPDGLVAIAMNTRRGWTVVLNVYHFSLPKEADAVSVPIDPPRLNWRSPGPPASLPLSVAVCSPRETPHRRSAFPLHSGEIELFDPFIRTDAPEHCPAPVYRVPSGRGGERLQELALRGPAALILDDDTLYLHRLADGSCLWRRELEVTAFRTGNMAVSPDRCSAFIPAASLLLC